MLVNWARVACIVVVALQDSVSARGSDGEFGTACLYVLQHGGRARTGLT